MDEHCVPVETNAGIISGRDAIYLDDINFTYSQTSVEFIGELNCALCSAMQSHGEFVRYQLKFSGVLLFRMIELDFAQCDNSQSSFDLVQNSALLSSLRVADHSSKLQAEHCHYLLATYDDLFEIIATGYQLDVGEPRPNKS